MEMEMEMEMEGFYLLARIDAALTHDLGYGEPVRLLGLRWREGGCSSDYQLSRGKLETESLRL